MMMDKSKTVSLEQSPHIRIEVENVQGRHILCRERPWLRIASVVGAECFLPIVEYPIRAEFATSSKYSPPSELANPSKKSAPSNTSPGAFHSHSWADQSAARYALFLFRQNNHYYLTVFPLGTADWNSEASQRDSHPELTKTASRSQVGGSPVKMGPSSKNGPRVDDAPRVGQSTSEYSTSPSSSVPVFVDDQPLQLEIFRAYPVRSQFVWNESRFTILPSGEPSETVTRYALPAYSVPRSDARAVTPLATEVLSPDDRGSAGPIQPIFSIRSGRKELARRRLSRTLTWIGRSRFASLPILHPSVAPAHCVCWWDGETVEVIDLFSGLGSFAGAVPQNEYRGVSGTDVSLTRDERLQRFDVRTFRPGERLQFGREIEIRFPGFTKLAESRQTTQEATIRGEAAVRPLELGLSCPTKQIPQTSPPVSSTQSFPIDRTAPLSQSSAPSQSFSSSQSFSTKQTHFVGSFAASECDLPCLASDEPRCETNDCVRGRHGVLRQREELEQQSQALQRREEQLCQQEIQQRQMRTILMSQQNDLEKLRDELDQRQRQQEEITRLQQREQRALSEEKQQIARQREEIEQIQQRLSEERSEWVAWRRRYEAEMFRLAAEFAQRNMRDDPHGKRMDDFTTTNDSELHRENNTAHPADASYPNPPIPGGPISSTLEETQANSTRLDELFT